MSGSVFQQYHKYFESLINQHKASFQPTPTDDQSQHTPQPAPSLQPLQQFPHQDQQLWQSNNHQQPPHQRPQHQEAFYPYYDSRRRHPRAPPSHHGYYSHGPRGHAWPAPWHHQPALQPRPQQMSQEDLLRFYYNNRQLQDPTLMQPQYPKQQVLLPQSQIPTPFQPDGQVGAEPEDEEKRKSTFCYPNSVNGYKANESPSGSAACGPCSSCNLDAADKSTPPAETLEQYLQQRAQAAQPEQPPVEQQPVQPRRRSLSPLPQQQEQQQQIRRPPTCTNCPGSRPGNGCESGKGENLRKADEEEEDGQDRHSKECVGGDSKQRQRLPLNARTPFTVGTTAYQYFYDTRKLL